MMTTQSLYRGRGGLESFGQPTHEPTPSSYQERTSPYCLPDKRRNNRLEREIRHSTRSGQEPENGAGSGSVRKRIAVACSRCRKRKIRCSGDPGDGTGCQACRANGNDASQCNFVRVNSQIISLVGNDALLEEGLQPIVPSNAYLMVSPQSGYEASPVELQRRSSLPVLQGRAFQLLDLNSPFEHTSMEGCNYTSASVPRRESVNTSVTNVEACRNWNFSGVPASIAPSTTTTAGAASHGANIPAYSSFGNLQVATTCPHTQVERFSSIAPENFSALNMNSLQSSLPFESATRRRLQLPPLPQNPRRSQMSAQMSVGLPDIRHFANAANSRSLPQVVQSRNTLPWSDDENNMRGDSNTNYEYNAQDMYHLPQTASVSSSPSSALQEPFGYQIPLRSNNPDILPSTIEGDSSQTTSTIASHFNAFSDGSPTMLPPISAEDPTTSSLARPTSLFTLAGDSIEQQHSLTSHQSYDLGGGNVDATYPPMHRPNASPPQYNNGHRKGTACQRSSKDNGVSNNSRARQS